jgi:hypothetical protein
VTFEGSLHVPKQAFIILYDIRISSYKAASKKILFTTIDLKDLNKKPTENVFNKVVNVVKLPTFTL